MKDITRRDFVRNSVAAGTVAITIAAPDPAAQSQTTPEKPIKIVAVSCSPRKGKGTTKAQGESVAEVALKVAGIG